MSEKLEEEGKQREELDKEDIPYLKDLISRSNYEEFVDYFSNSIFRVNCSYMIILKGYKLAKGEQVWFREDNVDYFGIVEELVRITLLDHQFGFVKLRLYYNQKDLLKIPDMNAKIVECTELDLFLTEKRRWFNLADCFKKIDIEDIDDYVSGKIGFVRGSYFTRATYDTRSRVFFPGIDKWQTYCFCERLYDPKEKLLQCDKCDLWLHFECSGLSDEQLKTIQDERFYCPECKKKKHGSMHRKSQSAKRTK